MNIVDGTQPSARGQVSHSIELQESYHRVLAGSSAHSRYVEVGGNRVHLVEKGAGPPVVLLHGTGNSAGFFLPLLNELNGIRVIAPDLPGVGMSDPVELSRDRYRETAITWLDRLLDTLELDTTALLGHSGGGMWALWYALARPDRVSRLMLLAPPLVPKTRCPLPIRLMATPWIGGMLSRLLPPTRESMLRFARFVGEEETLARHPELIDLLVALGRDPITDRFARAELRVYVSPFALLLPSGFRRQSRIRPDELSRLAMPTLVVWGERETLGDVAVAQAMTELIPHARLEVLPTGHGPWLGQPEQTAAAVADFVR